jgi:hypothetical protein
MSTTQPTGAFGSPEVAEEPLEITPRQRFWMGFWPFQLVRFAVLNLKILKSVNVAKRS